MGSVTTRNAASNFLTADYDFSRVFIFDNTYHTVTIAASGADVVLAAGTPIGVVTSTYQIYKSGTSNISFIGICAQDLTITDGTSATVLICITGEVVESAVSDNMNGTDTLDTVVAYVPIRDLIARQGIVLRASTELSAVDN